MFAKFAVAAVLFCSSLSGYFEEVNYYPAFSLPIWRAERSDSDLEQSPEVVRNLMTNDTKISYVDSSSTLMEDSSKFSEPSDGDVNVNDRLTEFQMAETAKSHRTRKERRAEVKKSMICDVKIVVDYPYFSNVAKFDRHRAVSSVVNIMGEVDSLFRGTDFNGDGQKDNLGFFISDIKVYVAPVLRSDDDSKTTSKWDPKEFFTNMKRYDFSGACAGLLFTYRKMQSSEMYGPSNIKSTINSTNFGLCSSMPSDQTPEKIMDNYGSFITNAVPVNFMHHHQVFKHTDHMVIQVAHQLAQLFGAPTDDDTPTCNTTDPAQMNIMAYPVPPGYYNENQLFSSCSKAAIVEYLNNMSRPCLKLCRGPKCSVKRSMTFPLSVKHNVTTNITVQGSGSDFQTISPVSILLQILAFEILMQIFF